MLQSVSWLILVFVYSRAETGQPKFVANISHIVAEATPALVGFGLEDANFQIYGGLYSQLIFGESFEEPHTTGYLHHRTWLPGKPEQATLTKEEPFNGKQSLRLQCRGTSACGLSNMGLDRWGLSVEQDKPYPGYLFVRGSSTLRVGLCPAHMDGALPAQESCYGLSDALRPESEEGISGGPSWRMLNFTLLPHSSNANSSFVLWLVPASGAYASADIDMVFLEAGEWARYKGMHIREDLANAILVNHTLGFLRFGGDIADSPSFHWRSMRGPAWSRPPCLGCTWNPYSSNGFGIFEILQFREAAGIDHVIVDLSVGEHGPSLRKCGRPGESFQSAADLVEYLFGDASMAALGRLRASDGHAKPYDHQGIIFEISNECPLNELYLKGLNETISAMWTRALSVAPDITLTFGSMGNYLFDPSATELNRALADLVQHWAEVGVRVVSDQHVNAGRTDQTLGGITIVESMKEWLTESESNMQIYVGEENCATNKLIPNDPFCHGIERALLHSLQSNAWHRMSSNFILGHALVTTFGATNKQWTWPQGTIEFGPARDSVLLQPPWHSQQMIGTSFRRHVLETAPARYNDSNGSVIDLLLLHERNRGFALRIVNAYPHATSATLSLTGNDTDCSTMQRSDEWKCKVLTCGLDASKVNTWTNPRACVAKEAPLGLHVRWASSMDDHGANPCPVDVALKLAPLSLTVCTAGETSAQNSQDVLLV